VRTELPFQIGEPSGALVLLGAMVGAIRDEFSRTVVDAGGRRSLTPCNLRNGDRDRSLMSSTVERGEAVDFLNSGAGSQTLAGCTLRQPRAATDGVASGAFAFERA